MQQVCTYVFSRASKNSNVAAWLMACAAPLDTAAPLHTLSQALILLTATAVSTALLFDKAINHFAVLHLQVLYGDMRVPQTLPVKDKPTIVKFN